MGQTVIQLIQGFCRKTNIPDPSTSLASATDPNTRQLVNLFYEVCRDLRSKKCWPQLKKDFSFNTVNGVSSYAMPTDFYCTLLDTYWDRTNRWKLRGPETDARYNELLFGYAVIANQTHFRIFGLPGENQFQVTPTPGAGPLTLGFNYISSSFIKNSTTGVWGETITFDADTCAFDDDLMLLGMSVNWPNNKGLQYEKYLADYNRLIQDAMARWQGSRKTRLSPEQYWPAAFYPNIPEGNWTL